MNEFKIVYQKFRELYVVKDFSDFEIIFWGFLTIYYIYRKYKNYGKRSRNRK